MRTNLSNLLIAAFVVALGLASGCVDTPLVAPTSYKMTLTASPSNVVVPVLPEPEEGEAVSDLVATVLSDVGIPQRGYSVYFSTSSGTLATDSAVTTDDNGRAHNSLKIKATDQTSIQVTASSGALTQTVSVTQNGVCDANIAPTAVLTVNPTTISGRAAEQKSVTATGTASTDDDEIAAYDWNCGDGTGIHTTTPPTSTYECMYTLAASDTHKTITLVVRDNGNGTVGTPTPCEKSSTPKTVDVPVTITP